MQPSLTQSFCGNSNSSACSFKPNHFYSGNSPHFQANNESVCVCALSVVNALTNAFLRLAKKKGHKKKSNGGSPTMVGMSFVHLKEKC